MIHKISINTTPTTKPIAIPTPSDWLSLMTLCCLSAWIVSNGSAVVVSEVLVLVFDNDEVLVLVFDDDEVLVLVFDNDEVVVLVFNNGELVVLVSVKGPIFSISKAMIWTTES